MVLVLKYSLDTVWMGENGDWKLELMVYFVPQIKAKPDQNWAKPWSKTKILSLSSYKGKSYTHF